MKKLVSYKNKFKAELLLAKLSQNGIHAVQVDKKESITQSIGNVEIHVPTEEYDKAVIILDEVHSNEET